jgi:hypothetical protein
LKKMQMREKKTICFFTAIVCSSSTASPIANGRGVILGKHKTKSQEQAEQPELCEDT